MARCGCSNGCNCSYVETVLQTPLTNPAFTHALAGADGVFELIGEVPALTIVQPGIYQVTMNARGSAGVPSGTAARTASVYAAVAKNGIVIAGTETMVANIVKDVTAATPALTTDSTGSATFSIALAAGDVLTVRGARTSVTAAVTSIISGNTGRTRLFARNSSVS